MFKPKLSTLLLATLTVACLVSMFVLRTQTLESQFTCQSFPPNDAALMAWLQEQHPASTLDIKRDGGQLRIQLSSFGRRPQLATTQIPMEKFGYSLAKTYSKSYSSQPSTMRFWLTILFAGMTIADAMRNKKTDKRESAHEAE